jgi:hypothetical protein
MNNKKLAGLVILIITFIVSCSGDNGKIRKQTPADNNMTLSELRDSWQDYHIYYGTRGYPRPEGIMFDPKSNDTRLVGESWIKISDQKTLSESISMIQSRYDYAKVEIIEGPDKQNFGYLYYPYWLYIPVKKVNERTLYVSSMPPHASAP